MQAPARAKRFQVICNHKAPAEREAPSLGLTTSPWRDTTAGQQRGRGHARGGAPDRLGWLRRVSSWEPTCVRGKTKASIPILLLGGGAGFKRPVDSRLKIALDHGLDYIDTARGYAHGVSERNAAATLNRMGVRDNVWITSKRGNSKTSISAVRAAPAPTVWTWPCTCSARPRCSLSTHLGARSHDRRAP